MIKHLIFDLDGVLVDARELHYDALNLALAEFGEEYKISREEHLSTYDGLPTSKKLAMLTEKKGLPEDAHNDIWRMKQEKTAQLIDQMTYDERMRSNLRAFKMDGYSIHVASNSIKHTIKMMLLRKGLIEYVDEIFSNQDVKNPKPNPEVYLRSIIKAGVSPKETLIIEDSHIGRKAALESGAYLHAVKNPDDVCRVEILKTIFKIHNTQKAVKPKWQGGNMNVLIPMAGAGSRFEQAGYSFPKPLIDVNGKPMIQVVVENLNIDARHIFIVQKSHYEKYHLKNLLTAIAPNCEIVQVDGVTEGAACTTLLAKEFIDNGEPLVIANSDQYVDWDSNEFMYSMIGDSVDAGILTFKSHHPKWSYVRLNEDGFVCEVAEKNPISDIATVGIYYWGKGSDYVKYAEQMIANDTRVNGEFYVCPVFQEAVEDNKKIKIFNIGSNDMWGLGTPEDLNRFLQDHE